MSRFPFYRQLDKMDCAPSCLRMICRYYGKHLQLEFLRKKCYASRSGVSLWQLSNAATDIGFRTLYARVHMEELRESGLPCIVHWAGNHFVVVYKITRKKVIVGDPAIGILTYSIEEFIERWTDGDADQRGVVLFLEPSPRLYLEEGETKKYIGFRFFLNYLLPFRKYYLQLFLGMLAGLGFSLVLPFLTQSMVDVGINGKNMAFINLVLLAQLMFSLSSTIMGYIRSWIFMHVGTRINIAIISDYLIKLFRLPISFFDSKMIGDIIQRIGDHGKVQSFISAASLGTIFSFINFFVFSFIMAYYSLKILIIFLLFSCLYAGWIVLFLRKRKEFNYKFFERSSLKQNTLIQLLYGIRDIKLHNYEDQKRWEWERLQTQTFKISIKQLVLNQYQGAGAFFIETTKGIIISYLTATLVISGEMTLGMMLSMQYILGQVGAPISQLIGLINSFQDARISLERVGEIHALDDEEKIEPVLYSQVAGNDEIQFSNVSFSYSGSQDQLVLKDVSFTIPRNKITAIVGESGSGKTTILKLLLKFYPPTKGQIFVNNRDLKGVSHKTWRNECGAVLQDGYIFSDTVAENISLGDENISLEKLERAATIANIHTTIKDLPLGYNTKIGIDGIGISQGQRQRILIARSVYKDPKFIFFDEATNSLDSKNEGIIIDNLSSYFENKTVVIVAHRLSTVKNSDQIVVLKEGKVVEVGNHRELLAQKGFYFELVQKQTETIHN